MNWLTQLWTMICDYFSVLLHLDQHLNQWVAACGPWIYVLLFAVVFCETGLVVTPFLPGDSLLFALGALTASDNASLSFPLLLVGLIVAGILGDAVNYSIGRRFGLALFKGEHSRLFNRRHLVKTEEFYAKHGGKTIIIARFMPIIRTFAPFVAGMGQMSYRQFAIYNVVGAILWVALFLTAGRIFGDIPVVKRNFEIVIFAIIGISLLPIVIEYLRARRAASQAARSGAKAS